MDHRPRDTVADGVESEARNIMRPTQFVHHHIVLFVALAALWLALSGHFTGLLLTLGLLCVFFCVWLAVRMAVFDEEVHPAHFHLVPCLKYWLWLSREVVISAVDVSKRVLDPQLPISPRAITLPLSQRTEIGRVTYANSITLTPGTVSIDLGEDFVRVHALTKEGADALIEGEMDRRVTALERGE
ncbi:MAG: multicomponent Na+:H+ antiporter subunit E [Gammaproteobacteria bacterium]